MATTTSQPVGTPSETHDRGRKNVGVTPSGPRGDNPSTAGPGPTSVKSDTPENADGHLNPSPEDANVTPATAPEK
jgi:hypothetical protein